MSNIIDTSYEPFEETKIVIPPEHIENCDRADAEHTFHPGDDEASKVLAAASDQGPILDGEGKDLLRRIDWHILPLICVTYGLVFADKAS